MNYEQAVQLQQANLNLIGKKGKYVNETISGIYILPIGNERLALEEILTNSSSPSEVAKAYNIYRYTVVVTFEINGNYVFEDLALYVK